MIREILTAGSNTIYRFHWACVNVTKLSLRRMRFECWILQDVSKGSIKIKTAESDTVCGVDLDVNKVYLLNGKWSTREMIKIFYYLMSPKMLSVSIIILHRKILKMNNKFNVSITLYNRQKVKKVSIKIYANSKCHHVSHSFNS